MDARVCACEIGNGDRELVEGTIPALTISMDGSMARKAMLAPALLTRAAVPVVAIRAVVGCARGDGFLCVRAEEL
jgi:hypothetical protein